MNSLLKKSLLLLFYLFAVVMSASAAEYTTVVAGTEFEPISGTSGFFIKDKYGNTNSNLQFINLGSFEQDIEVCDNDKIFRNGRKLYFLDNKEEHGGEEGTKDAYKPASNKTDLSVHEYVVSTPKKVNTVGGLNTLKNKSYSEKWMFITKTHAPNEGSGPGSSILFYTLKNPKIDSNFKVEIGFVNIAEEALSGRMSVNLKFFIYGVMSDGSYHHIKWGTWNLNSGQSQNLTTKQSEPFSSGTYDKIIVAILNNGSECNHIFGLDYIHIYSQYDIMEKSVTPTSTPYTACVAEEGQDLQLSSFITIPEEKPGELKIYDDAALTNEAPTSFNTGVATDGTKTYYYTYKEEGKTVSDKGTLKVTINPKPTISALVSKNSQNVVSTKITCAEQKLTITPSVSTSNVTYSWTGPDNFSQATKTIEVRAPGKYTLVVTNKTTGCVSDPKDIVIEEDKSAPIIEEAFVKDVDGNVITNNTLTCKTDTLLLSATVTSDNDVNYKWTGPNGFNKTTSSVVVTVKGTYTLEVTDKKTGCESEKKEFVIKENKEKPVINKIVSTNAAGDETNIVTCTNGTLTIIPTISTENVTYQWDNNKTTQTITETEAGKYTLVVTDKENGCVSDPKSITLTKDESVPSVTIESFNSLEPNADKTNLLTCSDSVIYIVADVTPTDVTYIWNGDESYNENYLKVKEPGTYTLKVVSNVNGCTLDGIEYEVKQNIKVPTVKLTPGYNLDGTEASKEFTCERKYIILEVETDFKEEEIDSYIWSNGGSTYSWQEMDTPGDYSVTLVGKNGCKATSSVTLTQNIVAPDFTATSLDSKGEERTVLTCDEPEVTLNITLNNESELGNEGPVRYFWIFPEINKGDETQTIKMQSPILCQAEVIGSNGCKTSKEIRLTLDKDKPNATITKTANTITCLVPSVTISATTDIEAEYEWSFEGESKGDGTEITVDKGGAGYLIVTSKTSGCSQAPYLFDVVQSTDKPSAPVVDETKLVLCPNNGNVAISSFLVSTTSGVTYTFKDDSGEKIENIKTNDPNTIESYKVIATASNGCTSTETNFDVTVLGLIDFELQLSESRVLAGGNQTVATIIPIGVEADQYQWFLNGKEVSVDGLEYATNLYIDTEYQVRAISRCDVKTQKAEIEVVWPTAFTPHNDNGKNEDFAKGLPIIVFNRFYTKIFEGPDGWDGTINGTMNNSKQMAVPGVYFYSVKLPNGQVKKGTIEIVKVD